jgi:hypothetical protein
MGIGSFFKKIGEGTKQFFKKGGVADTGLRKVGNTLTKVGGVAQSVAPLLSVVAPEIGIPLMAGGALAKLAGNTAQSVRSGARKGGDIVQKTQNVSTALKSGLEASMPLTQQLGANFA